MSEGIIPQTWSIYNHAIADWPHYWQAGML